MPAIKNFGLRWRRNLVNWGTQGPGNAGSLLGVSSNNLELIVDFRDQFGLYVLHDMNMRPIYIGKTTNGLLARLRNHRDDWLRDRWEYFSWFGFRQVNADGTLHQAQMSYAAIQITYDCIIREFEFILIETIENTLNGQSGNINSIGITEYRQYNPGEGQALTTDEEFFRDVIERLRRIEEHIFRERPPG